jgi:hypothetical protein
MYRGMKVPPSAYLAMGLVWIVIAADRLFFHPSDTLLSCVTLLLGLGFLGQFVWVKRRT